MTSGFLVLDKPVGPSSMQAVSVVRRRAGRVKTGHGGTLDPLASGVLVLGLGRATRLLEKVVSTHKEYLTEIDLSIRTATDDLEGEPEHVQVDQPPDVSHVESALRCFEGDILQRPPAFSAIKIGGRRAYAMARRDQPVDIPPRPVRVDQITLVNYQWPIATVSITCGKGFYVRSLARDLGQSLCVGGCCASIRRTAVGPFSIIDAIPLDEVPDPLTATHVMSLEEGLSRLGVQP